MTRKMIEWNVCNYNDCMDEENGLPYLVSLIESGEMEKFDLGLTDPPYNIDAGIVQNIRNSKKIPERENVIEIYDDVNENYEKWSLSWFNLMKKICNRIIFTCGKYNIKMWLKHYDFDIVAWIIPNSASRGFVSKFIKWEPILCYGDFKRNKLMFDVINQHVESGFLVRKEKKWIHPHPKPRWLYYDILRQLKPRSVIDPFFGSGVSGEMCMELNIPFISYELKSEYEEDWRYREFKVKSSGVGMF